ncbi:MAG: ABC transporter permease [Lachnospiraceae bacterium]|nr:ABC transporter permease [Lachnospiraceae bacterium]
MELYRLEVKKIRLSAYLWGLLGMFASLLALGILFLFLGNSEPEDEVLFTSWSGLFAMSTALNVACFSIFSAVIAARIIVDEYCGKNAVLLFTYPVSRRTILNRKSIILIGFTTAVTFVSNILIIGGMYITARIFGIIPELTVGNLPNGTIGKSEWYLLISVLLSSFFAGILSSAIGMISAVIGWKKRSVMTTIICSLIIVCFVPNLIAGSLSHIVLVMFFSGVLFILAAYVMYQILAKGIERMEV